MWCQGKENRDQSTCVRRQTIGIRVRPLNPDTSPVVSYRDQSPLGRPALLSLLMLLFHSTLDPRLSTVQKPLSYILLILFMVNPRVSGQIGTHDFCFDDVNTFDQFFETDEPLHLTLEFDIRDFRRTRADEEYADARLLHHINDTCYIPFEVRLRTRGIFRKSHCYIPPFWMNIKDANIRAEGLEGVKKMKIVTHCMRKDYYQDYVLKEYLAYKLYNIITPISFRVRLLYITYVDNGRNDKIYEGWAFAIEPKELLAKRLDAIYIDNDELSMQHMNERVMDRLCMFNYMLGNTDYSIAGCHNIKIFMHKDGDPQGYLPVPYDFDFTGFVNTIYAKPAANTNISKVTQRYYTGPCRTDEAYQAVMDEFREHSIEMHRVMQTFEHLALKPKLEMLGFVESFFDALDSQTFIEWKLRISCK